MDEIEKIVKSRIMAERTIAHLSALMTYESAAVSPQTNKFIESLRAVIAELDKRYLEESE